MDTLKTILPSKQKINTICIAGHRYHTDKSGGVELQTRYIGEALASSGWQVAFLSPSLKGKSGPEKIDDNTKVWWYPHYSFTFQTPKVQITEMLDSIQPTVFYQRGRGQLTGNELILRYALKNNIHHVFALSSDADLDPFYELKTTLRSHKPIWKRLLLIPYAFLLDRAMKNILKCSNYLIAQHEGQVENINKKLGRNQYLLRTIHPELNRSARKDTKTIVLWACNYRPLKRGEVFVRLAERCKAIKCSFVMVYGKTKKSYIDPVLEKAKGKDNLTIYGEILPHELNDLIEKAILFVNTSEYEGFPNTFVQSWLRETPTISLNVDPGGVITREKIGSCSGSFEQLVKDVTSLIENDNERDEMGKRARAYAEYAHGFEHNKEKLAEFFTKIVTNNN